MKTGGRKNERESENTFSSQDSTLMGLAYKALNNIFIESALVAVIGLIVVTVRIVDRIFRTRFKHAVMDRIHDISRDTLSGVRKAQIKYVFRRKYRLSKIRIKLAGGSYWMSIPCIVTGIDRKTGREKKYMGKIINDRSALKHKYMTVLRNLGVMVERVDLKFDGHVDAKDMIEFERDCLNSLRKTSIHTPRVYGIHRLNPGDYILVMEFIEGQPLSKVEMTDPIIDQMFMTLKIMRDNGLFHGDIKLDNFLYSRGRIYVVDCLKLNKDHITVAQDFDLICAICALAQVVPLLTIMDHALRYYKEDEIIRAGRLMGVAMNKVDLDLSVEKVDEMRALLIEDESSHGENELTHECIRYYT